MKAWPAGPTEFSMHPGINLEFARDEGLDFEAALRRAREAGYTFVEPYVYSAVELAVNSHLTLQTASAYHHLDADRADVRAVNRLRDELGLRFSALDAHTCLLVPPVGVPYLRRAIDLAAALDCPWVISDEGPLPGDWITLQQAFDILCLSLEAIIAHGRARGVGFAIELHNPLTARLEWLAKLLEHFGPGELGVNFDTGNCFLAGHDPVEFVRCVAPRVTHVHVKDIPKTLLAERGRVTGTRVGVAVGEGVVDLAGIVSVLGLAGFAGVLSVECDTPAQAQASLPRLAQLIQNASHQPSNPR